MSASASKKRRKELLLSETASAKKEEKSSVGKKIVIGIIVAVLAIALIIGVGLLIKSEDYKVDYDTKQTAMTVGDYEVTVPMFNYFYTSVLNNYVNSGYMSFGLLQQGTPLSQQAYMGSLGGEDASSWEDQLISETKTQITNTLNLYYAAKDAGYEMTDESKDAVEESIKGLKETARANGYNFFGLMYDWFTHDYFGPGCTVENYREFAELTQYCAGYAELKEDDFIPSDDEIAAEYAENPNDYDQITYALYTVNAESDGTDEDGNATYSDDAIAAAAEKADGAKAEFPEDAAVQTKSLSSVTSSYGEEAAEWLFADRAEGDIEVFSSEGKRTYYVVKFISREVNDYNLANAYVLSFAFDGEGETAAAEKFEKLCKGATNGISEDKFTALAEKNELTATSGSVARHTYNDEITAFLFDSARKDGDIFTLADESSSTYYVIRFVSFEEDLYQTQLVEEALHHAAEDAWYEEIYKVYTAEVNDNVLANANTDTPLGRTFG